MLQCEELKTILAHLYVILHIVVLGGTFFVCDFHLFLRRNLRLGMWIQKILYVFLFSIENYASLCLGVVPHG